MDTISIIFPRLKRLGCAARTSYVFRVCVELLADIAITNYCINAKINKRKFSQFCQSRKKPFAKFQSFVILTNRLKLL